MRAPTKEDLRAIYWAKPENKKWRSLNEDGITVFSPETPQEVLDSYEFWKSRWGALDTQKDS